MKDPALKFSDGGSKYGEPSKLTLDSLAGGDTFCWGGERDERKLHHGPKSHDCDESPPVFAATQELLCLVFPGFENSEKNVSEGHQMFAQWVEGRGRNILPLWMNLLT